MKRISPAVTILETPDEVHRAQQEVRRERENRRESDELLSRIVTPRASSSARRSEPESIDCKLCTPIAKCAVHGGGLRP